MEILLLMALGLIVLVKCICEFVDIKVKEIEFEQSGKKMFY